MLKWLRSLLGQEPAKASPGTLTDSAPPEPTPSTPSAPVPKPTSYPKLIIPGASPVEPSRRELSDGRDAAIRGTLAEHGDDGTKPRHAVFYFYGGNFQGLMQAAEAAGFSARPTVNNDGAVLETTIAVDADAFEPVNEQMHAWAARFLAEYDGWECAVEAPRTEH